MIGLVQVEKSPRYVDQRQSCRLAEVVRGRCLVVLLFMDADEPTVHSRVEAIRPDLLQFHGSESAAFCQQFGLPWIKAVATGGLDQAGVKQRCAEYACADYILLDGHAAGEQGGSGKRVAGDIRTPVSPQRLMLAGGLNAEKVGPAIEHFSPAAVDVSSGIESQPGIKDACRMRAFLRAVEQAAIIARRQE